MGITAGHGGFGWQDPRKRNAINEIFSSKVCHSIAKPLWNWQLNDTFAKKYITSLERCDAYRFLTVSGLNTVLPALKMYKIVYGKTTPQ